MLIGVSAGGVEAVLTIVRTLPPGIHASLFRGCTIYLRGTEHDPRDLVECRTVPAVNIWGLHPITTLLSSVGTCTLPAFPSMPLGARREVAPRHILSVNEIGSLLAQVAQADDPRQKALLERASMAKSVAGEFDDDTAEQLRELAKRRERHADTLRSILQEGVPVTID
jgi:hypothetical protein